jgi:hypothetical protein
MRRFFSKVFISKISSNEIKNPGYPTGPSQVRPIEKVPIVYNGKILNSKGDVNSIMSLAVAGESLSLGSTPMKQSDRRSMAQEMEEPSTRVEDT